MHLHYLYFILHKIYLTLRNFEKEKNTRGNKKFLIGKFNLIVLSASSLYHVNTLIRYIDGKFN